MPATDAEILAAIARGTRGIVHRLTPELRPACELEGPELVALDVDPARITCRDCLQAADPADVAAALEARGRAAFAEADGYGGRAPWADPIAGPVLADAYAAGDNDAAHAIAEAFTAGWCTAEADELRRLGFGS